MGRGRAQTTLAFCVGTSEVRDLMYDMEGNRTDSSALYPYCQVPLTVSRELDSHVTPSSNFSSGMLMSNKIATVN